MRRLVAAVLAALVWTGLGVAAPAASAADITVPVGGSIQAAIDQAQPGDTIRVAAGEYRERLHTVRAGTAQAPITLTGPGATIVSAGHALDIDHSHVHVREIAIHGQPGIGWDQYPRGPTLEQARAFKESVAGAAQDGRLVYIGAAGTGVTGVVIDRVILRGAGGECVRLRNNATGNVVSNSDISWCGMIAKDTKGGDKDAFHNGEGVYIGTSPKSTDQPMAGRDTSSGNRVVGNRIHTWGSECFNVKEQATNNTFEGNECGGNIETAEHLGSLVELRGSSNTVQGNTYGLTAGAVVKIKADTGYTASGNRVDQEPAAASAPPGAPTPQPQSQPAPQQAAPAAPAKKKSGLGALSGLPYDIGVFAHSDAAYPERVKGFEEVIGRRVDVWQFSPQRESGFGTMLSETRRIVGGAPDGVGFDVAIPLLSTSEARQIAAAVAMKDPDAYIRPGWEFNLQGSWPWTVDRIGADAFKAGSIDSARGIREGCPQCRVEWNPNTGQGGVQRALEAWPGDQWVDIVGIDAYDWGNEDPMDGPGQLNEWAAWAKTKTGYGPAGVPLSLPEWGAHGKDGRGDNPRFIADVLAWAARNNVHMLSYFDEDRPYIANSVATGQMPQVGEALRTGFAAVAGGHIVERSASGSTVAIPVPKTAKGVPAAPKPVPVQSPGPGLPPLRPVPRATVPDWMQPSSPQQAPQVRERELRWGERGLGLYDPAQ